MLVEEEEKKKQAEYSKWKVLFSHDAGHVQC